TAKSIQTLTAYPGSHARCGSFSSGSSAAASFGSETASTGYLCKKVHTQKAKSPSHPMVINTSNTPSGSDSLFSSEGVTSRNFSSQIPIRIQIDIPVIRTGFIFIFRRSKTTKGTTKSTMSTVHASAAHGSKITRQIKYRVSSGRLPYQM